VQLALGEDPGEIAPPFLGQDYTVVSGPRPLRAVSLPQQRAEAPGTLLPAVPAQTTDPVEVAPSGTVGRAIAPA
jgi:hypothetical protein